MESNLEPNPELPHKFGHDTEQRDVVVAYNRDRNEDWKFVKPLLSKDLKEFEKYCLDSETLLLIVRFISKNKSAKALIILNANTNENIYQIPTR